MVGLGLAVWPVRLSYRGLHSRMEKFEIEFPVDKWKSFWENPRPLEWYFYIPLEGDHEKPRRILSHYSLYYHKAKTRVLFFSLSSQSLDGSKQRCLVISDLKRQYFEKVSLNEVSLRFPESLRSSSSCGKFPSTHSRCSLNCFQTFIPFCIFIQEILSQYILCLKLS